VASATTPANAEIWRDEFNRAMANLGEDWIADPEYIVNGTELENAGIFGATNCLAIFRGVEDPTTCQFDWGITSTPAGIDNAGFAVRLDTSDPNTADGYFIYRNVEPGEPLVLKEIVNGVVQLPILDSVQPLLPPPQAGDEFRVSLTSDANGHHFAIFLNGQLDGTLDDPQMLQGNGTYYCGLMSHGNLDNNIDNWQVETGSANLPPAPFPLLLPADGSVLPNLNAFLDWQTTTDPDGDPVTYTVYYSLDPGFEPEQTEQISGLTNSSTGIGIPLTANSTYYWKVRAQDPQGGSTFSTDTWSFETGNFQQVEDDFERPNLGPDWTADPTYSIVSGELDGTGIDFHDIAVYEPVENPVAVEWTWSENANPSDISFGGCLIGLNEATTNADGYFVFRNTIASLRWLVYEVVNGELTGSLGIGVNGRLPVPLPGDVMRVVFVKTQTAHYFECYINGVFDARMIDSQRVQGTAPITYCGLLLGENSANNVEDFAVTAEGLNQPPSPFSLIQPANGAVVQSLAPTMEWQPATDPNPGDQVLYSLIYDLDPAFSNPDTLPSTTSTQIHFNGKLTSGLPYYWKVAAEDAGGEVVLSNESWSFTVAATTTFTDNFNRTTLGPEWSGDPVMEVVEEELANTSAGPSFDMTVHNNHWNPDAVEIAWSPSANPDGIKNGGLALMLDATTGSPNGYFASIDPVTNQAKLEEIRNGVGGFPVASGSGQVAPPAPGDRFKVILTTDAAGHHFLFYVNRVFHSQLDDPNRLQGNQADRYAGVALRGLQANRVDDFWMESFLFGTGIAAPAPSAPLVLALHPNVPNPFHPPTVIPFDLPERGTVRITVFDVSGRAVRELQAGTLEPGRHAVTWDGRSTDGAQVGSGVYFLRMAVGDWSGTRKLMLLR
jgi:hypothetical protein